ncbi:EF-hand domain-containing protein [Pseudoscourfieldia marina]
MPLETSFFSIASHHLGVSSEEGTSATLEEEEVLYQLSIDPVPSAHNLMSTPAGNQAMGEVRKVLHGVRIADCPPELREKLAQYDTNGNGIIDPNELPDPMSAEMTYLKVSSFPKKVHPLLHEIDDEKNGKIELDELTEILTVYVDLKKANKEGSIAIKTLPKEIQATLKVFDVDGDGTVAPMELARGAELYKDSKKTAKRLTIFSGVLLLILCALVGVIVGLTAVVVENSKETKTDSKTGITYAKGSSKPSATAKVTKTDSIYDAVKKSASALRAIGSLTLGKPDGSSLMYTVTGAETHGGAPGKANAVAFYSARGDVINVTATSLKVTKEDGTIVMTDTVVAEKSRRRRLLDSGSTGTCKASDKKCLPEWTITNCGVEKQSGCTNCDSDKDGSWCLWGETSDNWCYCDPPTPKTLPTGGSTSTSTAGTDSVSEVAAAPCSAEKEKIKKLEQDLAKARQDAKSALDKKEAALKVANDEATAAKAAQKKAEGSAEAAKTAKKAAEDAQKKAEKSAKDCLEPWLVVTSNAELRKRVGAWVNDPGSATNLFGKISEWDTSKVTDMSRLFDATLTTNAMFFNDDISKWNTGKVTDMHNMFFNARSFNQDISGWGTGKVTDMGGMFYGATPFNQDISKWNTSQVKTMERMFYQATSFNQDISKWNTAEVTDMYSMFYYATSFNQDISKWNTGKVYTMERMFYYTTSFNQDISKWNTSKVESMKFMFSGAELFNQDISTWNTSKVTDMSNMFYYASAFNKNQKITASCENSKCTLKKKP